LLLLVTVVLWIAVPGEDIAIRFFREQDAPVLALSAAALLGLYALRSDPLRTSHWLPPVGRIGLILSALTLVVTIGGTFLIFGNYALSRDELLADFDAGILRRGMAIAPIAAEWRDYANGLMPQWMLPLSPEVGWTSGYLPGNAALRAFLGPLTGPVLAALSVVSLHGISRRLWPAASVDALVPLLVLVGSGQFLIMAMTPYAMSAHLAFNLLWLWCFLRGDWKGDLAALAAGFVATGLHQLLFHPLFAGPFILHAWFRGERRRAAVYAAAYIVIGLFWASYWQIALAGAGTPQGQTGQSGILFLWDKFTFLLAGFRASGIILMVLNLARFVAWQHVLLLPLVLLAWPAIRRNEGIARPLAGGVLITAVAMLILLPWQGHGWGYRYLHGLIGSLCLLSAYGWRSLAEPFAARHRSVLSIGTAVSVLVLVIHAVQAQAFAAPYRRAQAAIRASHADVVIVDPSGMLFAEDLVRNAPDLSNHPKIVDLNALNEAQLRGLCARRDIALFDVRHGDAAGIARLDWPEDSADRRKLLAELSCDRPI
jgi:hypothetical protein